MLTIDQSKKKKLLVWCFVEGMDHLAGPTAGNEGSMECYAPAESLRKGKTLNILTTETPGKLKYGTARWSRCESVVVVIVLMCFVFSFTTPESTGPVSRCSDRRTDWGTQVEEDEEMRRGVQRDMQR